MSDAALALSPTTLRDAEPAPHAQKVSDRYQVMALAAKRRKTLQTLLPWLVALSVLVFWEIACRAFKIPQFVLPPPSSVAASMIKWWSPLMLNAGQTLMTTMAGFAIAVVVGLVLGVALGSSTMVYHGLYPLIIAFESVPKVAIVPILVLWLDRKSTRLNSSHRNTSRMPSSA